MNESRAKIWQDLLRRKGWLCEDRIELPQGVLVYLYLPPATTDINTIELLNLQRVTRVTEHFIIHSVSQSEEEYFLWEDVQCLRIKYKRNYKAPDQEA